MELSEYLGLIIAIVISFNIFVIYFIFKVLQFVIQAVNLYKKMIIRLDATMHLLQDIRDNTKNFDNVREQLEADDERLSQEF